MKHIAGPVLQEPWLGQVAHLLQVFAGNSPIGSQANLLIDHAEDSSVDHALVEGSHCDSLSIGIHVLFHVLKHISTVSLLVTILG